MPRNHDAPCASAPSRCSFFHSPVDAGEKAYPNAPCNAYFCERCKVYVAFEPEPWTSREALIMLKFAYRMVVVDNTVNGHVRRAPDALERLMMTLNAVIEECCLPTNGQDYLNILAILCKNFTDLPEPKTVEEVIALGAKIKFVEI